MIRRHRATVLAAAAFLVSCNTTDRTTAAVHARPTTDSSTTAATPPSTPSPLRRLEVHVDTGGTFVGMRVSVTPMAYDASGKPFSTEGALISTSDPSVASLDQVTVIPVTWTNWGVTTREVQPVFRLQAAGTATITVTLGDLTQNVILHVTPKPPITDMLVVDTFTVVEYRVKCAWDCPYVAYAPLLLLHEPKGAALEVVAVDFTIPSMTTGLCRGGVRYAPGETKHLNPIDPYIYNNDLLFLRFDGSTVPDGPATATIIVTDGLTYGRVEATASIQRMVPNPSLPSGANYGWWC